MPLISLFESEKITAPKESIELMDFLMSVKHGKWRKHAEEIRNEPDKEKRKILKGKIQRVTVSGTFVPSRAEKNIAHHSGFICIDYDEELDIREQITSDPYTYAAFSSCSGGNRLAIIVKINKDKHKDSFRWLQNYYFNNYGFAIDNSPSNVASTRNVSYDPHLYVNEKSKVSKTQALEKKAPNTLPIVIEDELIAGYVKEIVQRGIDLAPDYKAYLELGFSLANGFDEAGRDYFHALCSVHENYSPNQTDKQYNYCLKGAKRSGISVGTFYYLLKEQGIQLKTDNKAVQIATLQKKSNNTREGTEKILTDKHGLSSDLAKAITTAVFSRDDITLKSISKDPEALIESLFEFINQNHKLRRNVITKIIEDGDKELKKEQLNTIFLRARAAFNTPNVNYDIIERIIFSEFTPDYNPITEYIEKNRHRSGTGAIDAIIKSIKTPTPNAEIFIRKWLLSIIACYKGYPVRSVLSLVGGQNTGKTEWFRRLLPQHLFKYYAESKLDAGKDDELLMCQKLIVMDDEMGGKSKHDEKRFKDLTSKNFFSLRAPYGRSNEDFKRLALLGGTSNDIRVINDPTGNTRILPIEVESIDHDEYNKVDKDELFMELVREYEKGDKWQLSREEIVSLFAVSNEFEIIAHERELLTKFFMPAANGGGITEYFTATELKDYIETHTKQQIRNMTRFGIELKKLFGKSIAKRTNGNLGYKYAVIKITPDNTQSGTSTSAESAKIEADKYPADDLPF